MIINSLPESFRTIMRTTTAAICATSQSVTSDKVIAVAFEEADHNNLRKLSDKDDSALNASSNKGHRRGKKPNGKSDKKCYNCGRIGHMSADCWRKGGGKEGQGPNQKKLESANATTSSDGDYVFLTSDCIDEANVLQVPPKKQGAIVDSGATSHFCPDCAKFKTFATIDPKPINVADGQTLHALRRGDVEIELPNGKAHTRVTLKDVLCAPNIAFTLISTSQIMSAGLSIHMELGWCEIWSQKLKKLIVRIPEVDGLYRIAGLEHTAAVAPAKLKMKMSLTQLHQCMGHISFAATKAMITKGMVEGIEITSSPDNTFCETCVKAKITQQPFPDQLNSRAIKYGERIHTDVWGPAKVQSLGKKQYYVTFMDDYSRETTVIFL
jgi:hypothetical protein